MAIDITAGGRLTAHSLVDPRKVEHMAEMVAGARLGGYAGERARMDLRETLSTSDAPFSFAQLINIRNLPRYDEATDAGSWNLIANTEVVPDFNPTTFYSLTPNFQGLQHGKDNDGNLVAPKVAELDTYQYAFGYTQEEVQVAVEKRGFKFGISLERAVNDITRTINRIPNDMLNVGVQTDSYVVYRALQNGVTADSQLEAGTDYITGDAIPANAPASAAAIRVAFRQVAQRTDVLTGAKIPLASRYYVVVPVGEGDALEFDLQLSRNITGITDGNITYGPGATRGGGVSRIAGVIESEWVDEGFYLLPAAGSTVRPSLVRVSLAGYTAPEVYVSNFNGVPLAGGASSNPYQAFSFDADAIDLKFRQFTNAALLSEDQLVWSDGSGS